MADISRLARFLNGKVRGIDLESNTPVVLSIKIGGATNTELTKTILDNLVALQNGTDFSSGTNSHTHDGRYFTETELGSNANANGASLIGIEDANTQFTGTDVEAALDEAMDAAQAAQADATANASDIADIRTMTGTADGDTDMGTYTGTVLTDATTTKANIQELGTQVDTNVTDIGNLETALGNSNATNMGTFTGDTITDNQSAKAGMQELETAVEANAALINGLEWQDSALDYVTDNTAVPATEVTGDRYILSAGGGAPHANWDGASAGDIVEFNGTTWAATTPTTGMFISADDEATLLYYWGGAAWSQKNFESTTASTGLTKVGFDIRLAAAAENASGIEVTAAGVIQLNDLGAFDTDDLAEGSTNLYHTTTRARTAAVDDTAYAVSWDAVTDQAPSKNAVYDKIESLDAADISYTPSTLADWDGSADPGDTDGALDQLAERTADLEGAGGNESVIETMTAGEAMSANTLYCVRIAKAADAGFVSGRVYLADKDAGTNDDFHVIGMIYEGSAISAGDPITVYKMGKMDLGAAHGLTDGQEHFLGAAGVVIDGGTNGASAPSTADDAVVSVCIARSANIIEVAIERRFVN